MWEDILWKISLLLGAATGLAWYALTNAPSVTQLALQ